MVEITVKVSIRELNAMENIVLCWNLCEKHNKIIKASDSTFWKFTQTCKKCIKLNKELRVKSLHLWSKLLTAYLETTKKSK